MDPLDEPTFKTIYNASPGGPDLAEWAWKKDEVWQKRYQFGFFAYLAALAYRLSVAYGGPKRLDQAAVVPVRFAVPRLAKLWRDGGNGMNEQRLIATLRADGSLDGTRIG